MLFIGYDSQRLTSGHAGTQTSVFLFIISYLALPGSVTRTPRRPRLAIALPRDLTSTVLGVRHFQFQFQL